MGIQRFATAPAVAVVEENTGNTRSFEGDGSAFLRVAGLKSLAGVALGTVQGRQEIPLSETRQQLLVADEREPRERVTEPLFELQGAGTDGATLVRSVLSNDGKFQKGVTFYVSGEWADAGNKAETKVESTGRGRRRS